MRRLCWNNPEREHFRIKRMGYEKELVFMGIKKHYTDPKRGRFSPFA